MDHSRGPRIRPSVVVLAGGRSLRFGRDKLAVRVAGRPSLARVLAAVRPLARDVRVSVSSAQRRAAVRAILPPGEVEFALDRPARWGPGPAGAIAQALAESGPRPVLIVPGDMPWLETAALARLVSLAESAECDVAGPCWGSGETEHLVQWHRNASDLEHLPAVQEPRLRARASEFLRAAPRTGLIPIAALTDRPVGFAHLTYASDLTRPRRRGSLRGPARLRTIAGPPKRAYRQAHAQTARGRWADAARAFRRESRWYDREGLPLLSRHALDDAYRASGTVNRGAAVRSPP
jgi:molybdopterin-guanine dinucleotide biosynthesis protein A